MSNKFITFIILCITSWVSIAEECQLPDNLNKKQMLIIVNDVYTPSNPNAGSVQQLKFTEKKIIINELTKSISIEGDYQYESIAKGVGLLELKLVQEDFWSFSRIVLMCDNAYSGKYIYSQSKSFMKPDKRQNTGDYIIEN